MVECVRHLRADASVLEAGQGGYPFVDTNQQNTHVFMAVVEPNPLSLQFPASHYMAGLDVLRKGPMSVSKSSLFSI